MYESAPIERKDGSPVIGLALGSGAARGWSHLGVLRALANLGVRVDVVSGCSIGALVGAALASGRSDQLESWVRALDWQDVVSMLDVSFRGGLIRGDRVVQYCAEHFFASDFASLNLPFACVATELHTGREVWLREGKVAEAVQSSIALPGLFSPVLRGGRVLVDGGLVNPVPVSLCRALGAEIVIAVELGSGVVGRARRQNPTMADDDHGWAQRLFGAIGLTKSERETAGQVSELPSLPDVVTTSINIMQMRIARSRLAGEPADVVISPRVAHLNMMEFDRANEAIEEGEAAVERSSALLQQALELT
ncbi:patatin-like phospholipase RssA [Azoarcus taiwanensis]|uniref:Patatin-like phospholipase RssA n=1 Tax=Azoarcus taiwanensis TaxID=666964 RepID=A0A972JBE7_9RHOO|nr:patatin-like phospholipase RssA [Azoarcus taiwanensis]NMG03382.1 patatin-like phospholipase RssA [Azoarcus taiwanensis]